MIAILSHIVSATSRVCVDIMMVWPVGNESELGFRRQRILGEIDAGEMNRARGRLQDSRNHAQGRRLSGAVRAKEAEELAVGYGEVDGIDRGKAAVILFQLTKFD